MGERANTDDEVADSDSHDSDGPVDQRPHEGVDSRPSMSRRSLLLQAGSVAGALGLTQVLDVDRFLAPPDGTVTVETALVHPESDGAGVDSSAIEHRTRTVPADWHARVSAAFDLHERLLRTSVPGYLNSAVVPGTYDEGTVRISIGVRKDDIGAIPETIEELVSAIDVEWHGFFDGIDVSVERTDAIGEVPSDDTERDAYLALGPSTDPIPGGVRCQTGRRVATLAPALYHPARSEPFFGTALHAFHDADRFRGTAIELPIEGMPETESIGHALVALTDSDVAIAAPAARRAPGSVLGRRGELPIRGQLTRWGLADRVARGTTLLKIGGSTGYTRGPIHGIDAATCVTTDGCRLGQVTWGREADIGDGDSGSVTVDPEPDDLDGALVASINSARTWWPGQSHIWGISAHALTSAHGYHF